MSGLHVVATLVVLVVGLAVVVAARRIGWRQPLGVPEETAAHEWAWLMPALMITPLGVIGLSDDESGLANLAGAFSIAGGLLMVAFGGREVRRRRSQQDAEDGAEADDGGAEDAVSSSRESGPPPSPRS
jgi:hypothetical protein